MQHTQHSSFEKLMIDQSNALMSSDPRKFISTWRNTSLSVMNWFNIDRICLHPNTKVLVNNCKVESVERDGIPPLSLDHLIENDYSDYFTLFREKKDWVIFNAQELKKHKNNVLSKLYQQGGRWHCIILLQSFGQSWGLLTVTCFENNNKKFNAIDLQRLKLLCELWLCYWQNSTLIRTLHQGEIVSINESEKIFKLTKKQRAVLTLLAQGNTAKQCADKLNLSSRTIESHKYRMLDILNLDKHSNLIQFALRNGLGISED